MPSSRAGPQSRVPSSNDGVFSFLPRRCPAPDRSWRTWTAPCSILVSLFPRSAIPLPSTTCRPLSAASGCNGKRATRQAVEAETGAKKSRNRGKEKQKIIRCAFVVDDDEFLCGRFLSSLVKNSNERGRARRPAALI